jgi:hypothetical protein
MSFSAAKKMLPIDRERDGEQGKKCTHSINESRRRVTRGMTNALEGKGGDPRGWNSIGARCLDIDQEDKEALNEEYQEKLAEFKEKMNKKTAMKKTAMKKTSMKKTSMKKTSMKKVPKKKKYDNETTAGHKCTHDLKKSQENYVEGMKNGMTGDSYGKPRSWYNIDAGCLGMSKEDYDKADRIYKARRPPLKKKKKISILNLMSETGLDEEGEPEKPKKSSKVHPKANDPAYYRNTTGRYIERAGKLYQKLLKDGLIPQGDQ